MFRLTLAAVIFIAVVPFTQAQDDKVFRALTPEAAEKILRDLKIEFVKSSAKKGDEHYYDFKRDAYKVRLTWFSPTELMLDCVFRGMPIDKVNGWNATTRVSRASHHKDGNTELTILEYGLDISGGATEGTIKQFVLRYDEELRKYEKLLGGAAPGPVAVNEDAILAEVATDKIEGILKSQKITFTKKVNNAGVAMLDFEMNGHNVRLYNFNGKDLMIDAHFKKLALDDANGYNLSRKFVRVVNYKGKDVEYTALECNLDCEAGVSEGMIRHWINTFGEDVRHFAEYTKKLQAPEKK
ncbi:MAG: hypothetical protein HY289_15665 [Planctomycetes bacterium]|nr:hypothetical protein [Planctomycetota bacterium]